MIVDQEKYQEYISQVLVQLRSRDFKLNSAIDYKQHIFNVVAKKTQFQIERGGYVITFFIFSQFVASSFELLQKYSASCFSYCRENSGIHPPRGVFFSLVCFPVAIVDKIDTTEIETLQHHEPPKHWAASEMLAVYDMTKREIYCYQETPYWGSLYYDDLRQTINKILNPYISIPPKMIKIFLKKLSFISLNSQ